jgi:hypothetical protein
VQHHPHPNPWASRLTLVPSQRPSTENLQKGILRQLG